MSSLSQRGRLNVSSIMPRVPEALLADDAGKSMDKCNGSIDLSMAENWLIREEVLDICKEGIKKGFGSTALNWPKGFWGNPVLLERLRKLFNVFFRPHSQVLTTHIAIAPGAAGCLDALLYNICDAGDGVLVPGPYWNGYDVFFRIRTGLTPVLVTLSDIGKCLTHDLIPALEEVFAGAPCPIKALVISNPHNPLGRCYPKELLEECLKFCQRQGIHFISDEVFALSTFPGSQKDEAAPFCSALALDATALGCDPSKVHVVWSMSKDFGSSGIKVGCTVTQANNDLRNGLALAAHMNVSTLSAVFASELLGSPRLPSLVALNSARLAEAYGIMTAALKKLRISYLPCNAGPFILARVAPQAKSWDDEAEAVKILGQAGVLVGAGQRYHMAKAGWARISFAVERAELDEALKRISKLSQVCYQWDVTDLSCDTQVS